MALVARNPSVEALVVLASSTASTCVPSTIKTTKLAMLVTSAIAELVHSFRMGFDFMGLVHQLAFVITTTLTIAFSNFPVSFLQLELEPIKLRLQQVARSPSSHLCETVGRDVTKEVEFKACWQPGRRLVELQEVDSVVKLKEDS